MLLSASRPSVNSMFLWMNEENFPSRASYIIESVNVTI